MDGVGDQFDVNLFKGFLQDPNTTIVSVNPNTGKREYTCPRCARKYSYQTTLLRHLKFECGKQPTFQCPHCSYRCHRKENIKSHVIGKHEKGKKIQCPICPKTFVHKFRMQEHLRLFHSFNTVPQHQMVDSQNPLHQQPIPQEYHTAQESATRSHHPQYQNGFVANPFCKVPSEYSLNFESDPDDPEYRPFTSTPKKRERKPQSTSFPTETQISRSQVNAKAESEKTDSSINDNGGEPTAENGVETVQVKEESMIEINDSMEEHNENNSLLPSQMCGDDVLKVIF